MAFDFSVTDLKSHFTIDAAAIAWCEIETKDELQNVRFIQIRSAILQAVKDEELNAQIPEKIVEKRIRGDLYDVTEPNYARASILRADLKAWALSKGQKPKFLFPEMRDEKRIYQEEKASAKEHEIDKACVQAVVRTLRDIDPCITSEALSQHKAVRVYANGAQYQPSTIKNWIRGVDERPKDKRAGRPRKTAAENIQPQYEDAEK